MKLLLTIAIAVLQAFILIIPISGKLSDNRRNFPNNYTKRGWFLIACSVTTIGLIWWIFSITENEEITARNNLNSQLANRDSVNSRKLDSSNRNTVKLLAEYGLKVDSANKVLVKVIRDSSKRVVIENIDPVLSVCDIHLTGNVLDTITIKITFCSNDASSSDYKILTHIIATDSFTNNSKLVYISRKYFLEPVSRISSNNNFYNLFDFYNRSEFSLLYFYVTGTYSNGDNSKQYSINDVYYIDLNKNRNGLLSGDSRKRIISFVKKNAIELFSNNKTK
ncbi:MAG: hypothetical protein ACK4EY_16320 [Flavipsychrobacter sp.]